MTRSVPGSRQQPGCPEPGSVCSSPAALTGSRCRWADQKPVRPLWAGLSTVLPRGGPEGAEPGTYLREDTSRMLAERIDFVVGVDAHKHSHTAAIVTRAGGVVTHLTVLTDADGYARLLAVARARAPGRRRWAIEGTGSFGAGLTAQLPDPGEWAVEIDRPARPARRTGATTDELDAARAAREALAREHLAQPRRRGARAAMGVLLTAREGAMRARTEAIGHRKARGVNGPEARRRPLAKSPPAELLERCARLRTSPAPSVARRFTISALGTTARRALAREAEAAELESRLELLGRRAAPTRLAEPGVGTVSAARLRRSWSHAGRIRSEAAGAALAGVAPIPASSGQVSRHRLNRAGARRLNRALHTVVRSRLAYHAETRADVARRAAEGRSPREIKRCLKRPLARRRFKLLASAAERASAGHEPAT